MISFYEKGWSGLGEHDKKQRQYRICLNAQTVLADIRFIYHKYNNKNRNN